MRDIETALQELRWVETRIDETQDLESLRSLYHRVQAVRRTFPDDFDLQLTVADLQERLIERGRRFRENPNEGREEPAAPAPSHPAAESTPTDAVEMDATNWKRAVYVGAFFAFLLFAAFFYLVQMARKLNIAPAEQPPPASAVSNPAPAQNKPSPTQPAQPVVSITPTLRLYTDLVPGKVSVDGKPAVELQDGQLTMENLAVGRHSVDLTGPNGKATFEFDVAEKQAPTLAGTATADNALIVVISEQDGTGHLATNSFPAQVLVDGKAAGDVTKDGLVLPSLGTADHDLQMKRETDQQRFILTYTAAPAMTVFVKSDPNAGTMLVLAGQDDAEVYLNDKLYKRATVHGQLRIPSVKVGTYVVRIHKNGFLDVPPQVVKVSKGEEARAEFHLQPVPQIATLKIRGAQAGTIVYVDQEPNAPIGADGNTTIPNIKPGEHTIELRREGAMTKRFQRTFVTGDVLTLSGPDVVLEKVVIVEAKPPAPAPPPPPPAQPNPDKEAVQASGERIQKGGGFVVFHVTKTPGHYSFAAHVRKGGGLFKKERLQWFAGYQDPKNFLLFQTDGKHLTVREVVDGKGSEVRKLPMDVEPTEWLQVEMTVQPSEVTTRVRAPGGAWQEIGPVPTHGGDFTQGRAGFFVPGNDEIAVMNFKYSK
ncbi:MAG: hypothetical protein WBW33_15610 [Bryobacteraceae bacterium]